METMNVINISTGEPMLIKAFRFNPEIHKPIETPEMPAKPTQLEDMKRHELMKLAADKGFKTDFHMTKVELLNLLQNDQPTQEVHTEQEND